MSNVLLDLDTLVVRPKIRIDGKEYEILSPDELAVLTSHRLLIGGQRMEELSKTPVLTEVEKAELIAVVHELSDTIMEPIPAEVRAKLTDAQRMTVIEGFSTLLLKKKAVTAAAMAVSLMETTNLPTGGKRSPVSNGSTAARPGGGSPKRRSRS